MPLRRKKTKIGELLLLTGSITAEQLKEALSVQYKQKSDKLLGQIFIELGYINKEKLFFALSIQCGYPYIHINQHQIDPAVLSLIPEAMARKYQIFPIDKIQDVLAVAMLNPLDKFAIEQIQKFTGSNVSIFLTTPPELDEMFSKYYVKK